MVGDGHPTFNGILDTLANIYIYPLLAFGVDDLLPMGKQPPQLTPSLGYARCTTHKHLRQPTDGFKAKGVDALPDWRVPMLLAELVANLQMNHRMIHVTVSSINVKKPKSNKCKSFLHIFCNSQRVRAPYRVSTSTLLKTYLDVT